MHTCTNCGAMFDGYACPSCGIIPQQSTQTAQPYYGNQAAQQPPAYGPQGYQAPPAYQPQGQYPAPVYAPMPPVPPKSGHGKILIVLLVIIVVVIASIAGALLLMVVTNPFNDAIEIFNGDVIVDEMSGSGADDLYKIMLQPGEVLHATLSGAYGSDFDLYAYENMFFWDEYIITGSASEASAEAMEFVAWEDEYYIIDVYSYEGSGEYTLSVDIVDTISLDDGDNSIANAYPIDSGETIIDTLNVYYDEDDYYMIYVNSGQILYAFLEVPVQVATDFDLYIYDSAGSQVA
ncbi:MAG: hypothetical protein Q7J68_02110, partial [Thermoplasmata archaeon]|nr:hypothetical protein [Thermoplasmata archaeon]